MYVGSNSEFHNKLIQKIHASSTGGHSRFRPSYHRLEQVFCWLGMKTQLNNSLIACDISQRCKHKNVPYRGLLKPLPVPVEAWKQVNLDFIEGLPI